MDRSSEAADLNRLFSFAVRTDKPAEDLQLLLCSGRVRLRQVRVQGMPVLHFAAHGNRLQLLQLLLDHGCDVDAVDEDGQSALHVAARRGNSASVSALLQAGARTHWQRPACYDRRDAEFSDTSAEDLLEDPLQVALEAGNLLCVEALLRHGANPNCRTFTGDLVAVANFDNLLCLELLLRAGARADCFSRWGLSPLMRACNEARLEAALVLLGHKATVDLRSPPAFGSKTAMFYAMKHRRTDVLQLLLNEGADPNQLVQSDMTALELAMKLSSPPLVCCLLRAGADPNRPNTAARYATYPLQFLCSIVRLDSRNVILKLLLDAGARPDLHSDVSDKISLDVPCLPPLVEYFGCNEQLDVFTVYLLLQHGATLHLSQCACGYTLLDRFGLQGHLARLLNSDDCQLAQLVLAAAEFVDRPAIARMQRITEQQKRLVLSATQPTLKGLCRFRIRPLLPPPLPLSVTRLPLPHTLKAFLLFDCLY